MFISSLCRECGNCFTQCFYTDYSQDQAIEMIRQLKNGHAADILSKCITCMACNEICEQGANPYDLLCTMQEKHGIRLIPEVMVDFIDKTAAGTPNVIIPGKPDKPALSLCVIEQACPSGIAESRMFEGLTLVKGSDYYSSIVCLHTGFESRVVERVRHFIENLAKLNCRELVFLHNDCYVLAAKKASDYGIDTPFKPVNIVEYMTSYLKNNISEIKPIVKKIAFQRPCISRYIPEEEHWLDDFFGLTGVERLDRRYDRKEALCCSVGFFKTNQEKALPIIEKNIADAKAHSADAMVFLCPTCYMFMSGQCEDRGLPSIFITDLCRMAMGELPFGSRPCGASRPVPD